MKLRKEYFIDGILKKEEDLRETLLSKDANQSGAGKMYYRNGKLMYEWNLTNYSDVKYSRYYDQKGILIEEKIFDEQGSLIK